MTAEGWIPSAKPTRDNIIHAIGTGDDDPYSIAAALDCSVEVVSKQLTDMAGNGLLYRWSDNGVTRYGVCREERRAA